MVVTSDSQLQKLINFLLSNEKESEHVDVIFEAQPEQLLERTNDKELLMIDVDELMSNSEWLKVLKKRSNLHVLIQFTEMRTSTVQHVTELLEKNGIDNKIEFLIMGNYPSELKLILLKEQLSYLLRLN